MRRAILVALVLATTLTPAVAHAETWLSYKAEHPFHLKPLVLPMEVTPTQATFLIHERNHKLKYGLVRRWKAWVAMQVANRHTDIPQYIGDIPDLIRSIFTHNAEWAVSIVWCESRFNPDAVNKDSGAAGLWQWMPAWWEDGSFDPFDPVASTLKAWKVSKGGTDFSPWLCA